MQDGHNPVEPDTELATPGAGAQDQNRDPASGVTTEQGKKNGGPKSPPSPPLRHSRPRAVPLKEEFTEICRDAKGRPDLAAALVLQQLQYLQQGVKDADKYIDEEEGRAEKYPRRVDAWGHGWFKRSAPQLAEDMFGVFSESGVRGAIRRLQALGILLIREGSNPWDRTRELRLDLVRLAVMLAATGRLPEQRWLELGIVFPTEWPLAPPSGRAGNEGGKPSAAPADPSAPTADAPAPAADLDPRQPRVLSIIRDEDPIQNKSPLCPPPAAGDILNSLSSREEILRAQQESLRMLPSRISESAAMVYVASAPVARVFECIFGKRFAWTPTLARAFAKRVKSGKITLPLLTAGVFSNSPPLVPPAEFIKQGGFPHQDLFPDLGAARGQLAWDIVNADPSAIDLPPDLARLREEVPSFNEGLIRSSRPSLSALRDDPNCSFVKALEREARSLGGLGSPLPMLMALEACHDSAVPAEPDRWPEYGPWLIRAAAWFSWFRKGLLATPPGRLQAVFGISPQQVEEAARARVQAQIERFRRVEAVRDVITNPGG